MADVNYMQYADYMGRRNPVADGLTAIGTTLDQQRTADMQQQQLTRQNRLADMQMQQGQMAIQGQQDQQGALRSMHGTADNQGAIVAQMKSAKATADNQNDMNAVKEIFDLASKIKEKGLHPDIVSPLVKGLAGTIKNEKLRGLYENIKINPDWSSETVVPLDGSEGMKHPVTGQPLDPGVWKLKIAPDGKTTIGADFVKETAKDAEALLDKRLAAQERNTTRQIEASDRRANRTGGGQGKLPPGYRWTADGNQEAIPGGPADVKAETKRQSVENGKAAIDATDATIDKLLKHPGRKAATGFSSLNPINKIPGTDASDFNKELESFDSKLFLSNIQAMKGMGALSNAEGAKVSAAAGAIKAGMSEKAFIANMNTIKTELAKAKSRMDSGSMIQPTKTGARPPLSAIFGK